MILIEALPCCFVSYVGLLWLNNQCFDLAVFFKFLYIRL